MTRRMARALSLRPVRSVKEIIDGVFLNVAAGVTTTVVLADTVDDYTGTTGTHPIGSSIKAIYLEASYFGNGSTGRLDWLLMKDPGAQLSSLPVPGSTGGNTNRKWVFHESKGLLPGIAADGGTVSKKAGWIKIPSKMTRMGDRDQIILRIGASIVHSFCVKSIYKWFA